MLKGKEKFSGWLGPIQPQEVLYPQKCIATKIILPLSENIDTKNVEHQRDTLMIKHCKLTRSCNLLA